MSLRNDLIRLAHDHEHLREHILPLLKSAASTPEWPAVQLDRADADDIRLRTEIGPGNTAFRDPKGQVERGVPDLLRALEPVIRTYGFQVSGKVTVDLMSSRDSYTQTVLIYIPIKHLGFDRRGFESDLADALTGHR